MTTPKEYESLEALARAVAPGPWRGATWYELDGEGWCGVGPLRSDDDENQPGGDAEAAADCDAAFIAAASPDVVLGLIAEVTRLRAEREEALVVVAMCAEINRECNAALHAERDAALAEVARLREYEPGVAPLTMRERARRRETLCGADGQALEHALTIAERERDALKRHYDAAGPEHNLLALLDSYFDSMHEMRTTLRLAAEALGAVHEQSMGPSFPGTREEIVAAVEALKAENARLQEAVEARPDISPAQARFYLMDKGMLPIGAEVNINVMLLGARVARTALRAHADKAVR